MLRMQVISYDLNADSGRQADAATPPKTTIIEVNSQTAHHRAELTVSADSRRCRFV